MIIMCRSSDKLNFIHFADDATMYMTGNDLVTLCRDVSVELDRVSEWLNVKGSH